LPGAKLFHQREDFKDESKKGERAFSSLVEKVDDVLLENNKVMEICKRIEHQNSIILVEEIE
jgi:hypothetical protein